MPLKKTTNNSLKSIKKSISEQDIQKSILEYLSLTGWFAYKNNTVGIYKKETNSYIPNPSRGLADITAIKNGEVIMIEVKKPGGKQSEYQKEFQRKWEENGGKYYLMVSLDDLIKNKIK